MAGEGRPRSNLTVVVNILYMSRKKKVQSIRLN